MKAHPIVLYRTDQARQTRREILSIAVDIASAEGLEGLTVGRLASALGISRSGLFAHFGAKEELQLATVHAARDIFLQEVALPASQEERGLKRLRSMLDHWLSYVERIVFRGGCFFAAASAEFDSRPGAVRDEIASLTRAWLEALVDEVAFAKQAGQVKPTVSPRQLAFELHSYVHL